MALLNDPFASLRVYAYPPTEVPKGGVSGMLGGTKKKYSGPSISFGELLDMTIKRRDRLTPEQRQEFNVFGELAKTKTIWAESVINPPPARTAARVGQVSGQGEALRSGLGKKRKAAFLPRGFAPPKLGRAGLLGI